MAPPQRSRRKRHSKSPRNKRFGSGKSTPSSPAGTPTRHPHTQRVSDLAGTSRESSIETRSRNTSGGSLLASKELSEARSLCLSEPLETITDACTLELRLESSVPANDLQEELASVGDSTGNCNMKGGGLAKLDRLCGLLENIVIEHKTTVPDCASLPVDEVKSNTITSAVNAQEKSKKENSQELEQERKARKEAKKAKKGNNKENKEKETADVASANQVETGKVSQDGQKGKSSKSAGGQKNEGKKDKETEGKKDKETPESKGSEGDASGKSKADLKRERREKQEAQRKAKLEAKAEEVEKKQQSQQGNKEKVVQKQPKKKSDTGTEGKKGGDRKSSEKDHGERRIPLLGHLTLHSSQQPSYPINCDFIHPAVRTLGIKMKERVIDGSTARVVSVLAAFKRVIGDYQTPESCDLHRDLAEKLVSNVAFLRACRPLNIAMDNAIRYLKHEVNSIGPSVPEAQAKDDLRSSIDEYIRENIVLASSTIASHAAQVIKDGDVILTFGYSALVSDVVEAAISRGENVSVVVADTPHPQTGAAMVKRLAAFDVTTHYRLITEVSHIMNKVTKVIVEAESVMMNGAVQGLCGTAGLALAAANHDTPFIVLCHTYKFCNNDLTDSLVLNELGDVDNIVSCPGEYCNLLSDWKETPNLNVVSLVYDITPANLVTALITEQNVLPTSAVPVIIRRNYADILGQD